MPLDMSNLPPSPFADQPYDVKVANTKALVEQWLKDHKDDMGNTAETTPTEPKRHRASIHGIPIGVIIRFLWNSTMDGMRNNRYRLSAKFYIIMWMSLWLGAVGMVLVGVFEGLEMATDEMKGPGPKCGPVPVDRFYRVMARNVVSSLPLLVTLTIFFFPALVKP